MKKVLTNGFRLAIEQIKKGYKIEKNTEYLIEKLKEIGIVEENFEENKAIIPDIFSTLWDDLLINLVHIYIYLYLKSK